MKKLIAMLLALIMVLSLAACGAKEEAPAATEAPAAEAAPEAAPAPEAPAAPEIKVGIAAPDVTHGWVAGVAYYAEKYCQDNGLEYKVHTSADAAEMQAGLQDLVAWGATVIVSFPQWAGMETAMQEIIDMGIPVVNFDVDVACEGIYKVTGDNYDMGYQSAKYIVEKAGEAAHIAVLDVPSSGSVCELRKQGFYDYLAEINYDTSNIQEFQLESFARDDGLKNAADILEKMPQVDAFYSMDDETSIGTIQAMNDAGRTEIKAITGGGGCQEYFQIIASEEGQAIGAASALYSPAMIQDAIKVAIKLMNGEEAEPVIVIPTTIVSADNVADHLDPSNNVY
ncbi:MAG: substrate-binding domain-containing protein [Oscillospiraceae bacterium]|nr:substrate-binding domain-containing protein [Oscillospiraceae bacterium]